MAFDHSTVPLENPSKQIRLLTLHPSDDHDAEIAADLGTYCLDENAPLYVAISYTWGDRLPTFTIRVNGFPLRVHHNCWYALWQMRFHHRDAVFWIDQICIDQNNVGEKNEQVALMGEIYSNAFEVAVCLGAGNTLEQMESCLYPKEASPQTRQLVEHQLQGMSYFQRMWIKQEVILAKEVLFFCGLDGVRWRRLVDFIDGSGPSHAKKLVEERRARMRDLDVQQRTREMRRSLGGMRHDEIYSDKPAWASLLELMVRFGDSSCHEPRDRLFALLSLLPTEARDEMSMPIDHERPLFAMAYDIIHQLVRTDFVGRYYPDLGDNFSPSPLDERPSDEFMGVYSIATRVVKEWLPFFPNDPFYSAFAATYVRQRCRSKPDWMATDEHARFIVTARYITVQSSEVGHAEHAILSDAMSCMELRLELDTFRTNRMRGVETGPRSLTPHAGGPRSATPDSYQRSHNPSGSVFRSESRDEHATRSTLQDSTWSNQVIDSILTLLDEIPNDMQIRYATGPFTNAVFLVPAETQLGDLLLVVGKSSKKHGFVPIVRRAPCFRPLCMSASPFYLVGWAIPFFSEVIDLHSRGFKRERVPEGARRFHIHYEDLMLCAMLKDRPSEMLFRPFDHGNHSSGLVVDDAGSWCTCAYAAVRTCPSVGEYDRHGDLVPRPLATFEAVEVAVHLSISRARGSTDSLRTSKLRRSKAKRDRLAEFNDAFDEVALSDISDAEGEENPVPSRFERYLKTRRYTWPTMPLAGAAEELFSSHGRRSSDNPNQRDLDLFGINYEYTNEGNVYGYQDDGVGATRFAARLMQLAADVRPKSRSSTDRQANQRRLHRAWPKWLTRSPNWSRRDLLM